jgi:hypothetical protein
LTKENLSTVVLKNQRTVEYTGFARYLKYGRHFYDFYYSDVKITKEFITQQDVCARILDKLIAVNLGCDITNKIFYVKNDNLGRVLSLKVDNPGVIIVKYMDEILHYIFFENIKYVASDDKLEVTGYDLINKENFYKSQVKEFFFSFSLFTNEQCKSEMKAIISKQQITESKYESKLIGYKIEKYDENYLSYLLNNQPKQENLSNDVASLLSRISDSTNRGIFYDNHDHTKNWNTYLIFTKGDELLTIWLDINFNTSENKNLLNVPSMISETKKETVEIPEEENKGRKGTEGVDTKKKTKKQTKEKPEEENKGREGTEGIDTKKKTKKQTKEKTEGENKGREGTEEIDTKKKKTKNEAKLKKQKPTNQNNSEKKTLR